MGKLRDYYNSIKGESPIGYDKLTDQQKRMVMCKRLDTEERQNRQFNKEFAEKLEIIGKAAILDLDATQKFINDVEKRVTKASFLLNLDTIISCDKEDHKLFLLLV